MQSGQAFPVEKSKLYQLWDLEKEEIDKLKWIMSEQAKQDVGIDFTVWQWSMRFRDKWISGMKTSGLY